MSPRITIRPLSSQPDRRLVELARAGDERAFEVLVRRHRRALGRYARRIGLSEDRVEDALQQALTKAWLALERGIEVREPRAWLYRIVHNAALNSLRAAERHGHESIDTLPSGRAPQIPGEIDTPLRARDALGHVAALPEMQRDAIVLTAIEGRSHEEAATVLGVSDGAVRGLLYRARTTLRSTAAALSPQGLLSLLARASGDGGGLTERSAEVSAGGAAAGAGVLTKGFLATAVAGLLAAGGTVAQLRSGAPQRHTHPAAASSAGHASSAPSRANAPSVLGAGTTALVRGGNGKTHGPGRSERSRHAAERHGGHGRSRREERSGPSSVTTGEGERRGGDSTMVSEGRGGDRHGAVLRATHERTGSGHDGSDHVRGTRDSSASLTTVPSEPGGVADEKAPGSSGDVAGDVSAVGSGGGSPTGSDRHGGDSGSDAADASSATASDGG